MAFVENRRRELGLSPTDHAAATGLTVQGLLPLRKGYRRAYQHRLTDPVCRVFGWTPDSIDRILAGRKPALLTPSPQVDELQELRVRVAELESQVGLLLEISNLRAESDEHWPRQPSADG